MLEHRVSSFVPIPLTAIPVDVIRCTNHLTPLHPHSYPLEAFLLWIHTLDYEAMNSHPPRLSHFYPRPEFKRADYMRAFPQLAHSIKSSSCLSHL